MCSAGIAAFVWVCVSFVLRSQNRKEIHDKLEVQSEILVKISTNLSTNQMKLVLEVQSEIWSCWEDCPN